MFQYKKEDKKIVSHDDFDHDIKMHVPKGMFLSFKLIDILLT